eukprot:Pgem_evm1s19368
MKVVQQNKIKQGKGEKPLPLGTDFADSKKCECEHHEVGLVEFTGTNDHHKGFFNDNQRKFCHGDAKNKGQRVCHCDSSDRVPNYMQNGISSRTIREKTFHIKSNFFKSEYTQNYLKMRQAKTDHDEDAVDGITITSQGTWNRLEHLSHLVEFWQGPISFALLLDESSDAHLAKLSETIKSNPDFQKYVDFHLVWRADHTADQKDSFYPINFLRNVGLQGINTNYAFVLDVDVTPNAMHETYKTWLKESIKTRKESDDVQCVGLDVYVPVAVEMESEDLQEIIRVSQEEKEQFNYEQYETTISKEKIVEQLSNGKAKPMHLYFSPAYGPTNHFEWFKDSKTTKIDYITRFEPYYIAKTKVPFFHEGFVNRGGNFAEQVYEMSAGGYQFYRMPFALVVDLIHHKEVKTAETNPKPKQEVPIPMNKGSIATNEKAKYEKAKSEKSKKKKGKVAENKTNQVFMNKLYVAQMWDVVYNSVKRRYNVVMPYPRPEHKRFKEYRLHQGKKMDMLWKLLKIQKEQLKEEVAAAKIGKMGKKK